MTDGVSAGHLELVGLSRHFGDTLAVDRVSLTILAGEFVTLLGPSGSGKTTTLMMIAGFVRPSAGEIHLAGRPITRTPPYRRNVGMVFQNYALFPHMTVFNNVAFSLEMRGIRKREIAGRVGEALDLVKLAGYEGRLPRQLSGGQQQRVALARALVFNPPVLLMDEPLGALDKKLREHMQLELKRLQAALGLTVLYVTHDQEEALVLSDRIAVMNHGRIEQFGRPPELYETPANDFVAAFIGESNFFEATLVDRLDARWVAETPKKLRFVVPDRDGLRLGQHVRLSLRPEKVAVEHGTGSDYAGVVEETIYIGGVTKLMVRLEDSDETVTLVRLNSTGLPAIRRGDQVRLGWDPADVKVLASRSKETR